jgi:hypothetical protein
VRIEVREVLAGEARRGPAEAVWQPAPHDVDWVGEGSDELIQAWAETPLPGPEDGSAWILVGSWSGSPGAEGPVFGALSSGRFEYSDDRRDWALEAVKERSAR